MRLRTRVLAIVAASLAVTGSGCKTIETPLAAAGTLAVLEIFAEPNPVEVSPSMEPETQWEASFLLVVREVAGTGGTIDFVELNRPEGREDFVTARGLVYTGAEIALLAGTSRVDALGELRIPLRVAYTLASGDHESELSAFVHLTDDRGNAMVTASAPVTFR